MPPKRQKKRTKTDHVDHDATTAAAVDSDSTTVHPTTATTTTRGRVSKRLKTGPAEAATMSTMAANVDEEMKEEGISNDMDQVIKEESPAHASDADAAATTSVSASSPTPSIIPYGLLKLPQSIASELASDYLVKREIRDLGVTCRWMLVSLNQCVIKEPVSLEVAHRRLNRERILGASHQVCEKTANLREVVARVPNLFIGRCRNLQFAPRPLQSANVKQFSELSRFTDVRTLVIGIRDVETKLKKSKVWKYPIELPPKLENLTIEQDWDKLPLNLFVLPPTLRSISCPFCSDYPVPLDLTRMKWPEPPNGLTTLLNLPSTQVFKDLVLPSSILTIAFLLENSIPIRDLILPHSITDLTIADWLSDTGKYRDLPYPRSLRRLRFLVDLVRDDFNLNEWTHLPSTCVNLELILSRRPPLPPPPSPVHVTIPSHVKQLRIWRRHETYQLQRIPIHLLNATGLQSLAIDRMIDIADWPNPSSTALTALKLGRLSEPAEYFFLLPDQPPLPRSLTYLDLSRVNGWSDRFPRDSTFSSLIWSTVFDLPRLCRIKIPYRDFLSSYQWHPGQTDGCLIEMIQEWGRTLPNCILEGWVRVNRTKSDAPPTLIFQRYKNQELIHEFTPTESEVEAMKELDDQQFDAPLNPIN